MRVWVICILMAGVAWGQEVRRAVPVSGAAAAFNDQAKFLAGIPLPESSPLARLQESPGYGGHSKGFEKLWMRYAQNYFYPMREWSAREVMPRIVPSAPVFYFFGGPDALAVQALFPEATDYILGGLEPVGSLPPPESLDPVRLEAGMANLRKSTEVILSYGHFITKDMKAELEATDFRGVLPLMMIFVAMSGGEVVDVSYFGVGAAGKEEVYGTTYSGGTGMLPGVRITFRREPGGPLRRISYIQANVADDVLKSRSAVTDWAAGFGGGNVYLKAASYLMHEPYFSRIRGFLLTHGRSVLQDDSGIPLRFFRTGEWRLWFFGSYTGTLDIFKKYYQSELGEAFGAAGENLPFGTGYKWRVGESNLMLAVKQTPPRAQPVEPGVPRAEPVEPPSEPAPPPVPATELRPAPGPFTVPIP